MKREGRQHGVVRSYAILPTTPLSSDHRRYVKTVDSASVAGVFTKVSRKPTNQSKFTGKCGGKTRCLGCHLHPACKSKDKAKGTMKFRSVGSSDSALIIASGTSATGVLAYLASEDSYDYDYDDDCDEYENAIDDDYDYDYDSSNCKVEFAIGVASIVAEENIGDEIHDDDGDDDGDDDDCMSYCDVGMCMGDIDMDGDEDEDDGWYMVGHIQE